MTSASTPTAVGPRVVRGRRAGTAGWRGEAVVAGEFGGRARAGGRVGQPGGRGEDVGGVVVGAAGEGDVRVLAVLTAGDHGQAGVDGAALGDVGGDRVAEFGVREVGVQELSVRPAAPPGLPVGVQGAADEQALGGDGVDAEQVPVGQRPAGLPGLDAVVVAGAHDQVARGSPSAPSAMVTVWVRRRPGRGGAGSSRTRRDSSRRRAWSAAISSASVPSAARAA